MLILTLNTGQALIVEQGITTAALRVYGNQLKICYQGALGGDICTIPY